MIYYITYVPYVVLKVQCGASVAEKGEDFRVAILGTHMKSSFSALRTERYTNEISRVILLLAAACWSWGTVLGLCDQTSSFC